MNHTCDLGPGHPILATNRGTCPACDDQADRLVLETAHGMAADWNRSGMDGDADTVALWLDRVFHLSRAILSGDLDDVTTQILLSRVEQATEDLADVLDDLGMGDRR